MTTNSYPTVVFYAYDTKLYDKLAANFQIVDLSVISSMELDSFYVC